MTITPKEAMRLSHAAALGKKHGETLTYTNGRADEWLLSTEALAALIDEANAVKDATIARLRAELNEAAKEEYRNGRDAYTQGQQDEADRHSNNY